MDFALLPPEVNSGRMYAGAGAGPLLAASAAWDALAAELQTMGAAYDSALAELATGWSGPSAVRMASAAAPYAHWMHVTSEQAEHTAGQARAAVAAYESAFAMTVPPPVIAANRSLLMTLVATNFFGQNTAAIAATEAHYAQMWAQDATAMYTYAAGAAAATRLAPFSAPPKTTDSTPQHSVAAPAVGQAAGLLGTVLEVLTEPTVLVDFLGMGGDALGSFGVDLAGPFGFGLAGIGEIGEGLLPFEELSELAGAVAPSAAMGDGVLVGSLSVPQSWASSAPMMLRNATLPLSAAGTAGSGIAAAEAAVPFAEMAGAGLAGRASASLGSGVRAGEPTRRLAVPERKPTSPVDLPELPAVSAFGLLMGADVELRELAELRSAGILTDDEYAQQKRRLVNR
ncbi:PPE domain-containing protein [Mycobacterium sp. M1]|uniref:PPE domain-containing protein n=1 Tax=Mycolicibacter acidiphilus TaxID=2835306 RepID=A0ABS5RKM1_9MYCO|nr:PPE domain-containing protein [Mycolicibacter acidiphilus]MBS9534842.1 PPE domain-containing protein [Mycolicibacter acidiphilus]